MSVDALASIAVNVGDIPAAIVDRLPVGVCICDAEGFITAYNECATQLWGDRPGQGVRFSGVWVAYGGDGRALRGDSGPIATVLRSRKPQRNVELVLERKDGTRVVTLSNVVPLFDGDGAFSGVLDVFQDITDRNRLEEARRIADRTHASARLASDIVRQLQQPFASLSEMLCALRSEAQLTDLTRDRVEDVARQFSSFYDFARNFNNRSGPVRTGPIRA